MCPLAQRGHADRYDVWAIEQVLAKAARGNLRLEILVGGRHDAYKYSDSLWLPDVVSAERGGSKLPLAMAPEGTGLSVPLRAVGPSSG